MKITSVLLGSAAALVVATGAQAADLPGEAVPAAVDYVKVCDTFGTGFFYIPGTETCLKIGGRARFGVTSGPAYGDSDDVELFTNARVDFDTRSATELGTLRTFFRIKSTDALGVAVDAAYLQIGPLTAGYAPTYFDTFGALVGDNDRNFGGETRVQASVMFDDLGGGFYAGIGLFATDGALKQSFDGEDGDEQPAFPDVQAIVGITGQPWGSAALGVWYSDHGDGFGTAGYTDSFWAVKLGANIDAMENLTVALRTYYFAPDRGDDRWNIGAGVSYSMDALTLNLGAEYDFIDSGDHFGLTAGIDYEVVSGLVATAELSYDDYDAGDDDLSGMLRLSRSW